MRPTEDKAAEWIHRLQCSSLGQAGETISQLELWIGSAVDQVSRVVDEVISFIKRSGCFAGDIRDVELALREALSNAVLHGNKLNRAKVARVRCRCSWREGISLIVSDEGSGFAPERVRDPLAVENLALTHGRGIHFMKLLMDEVRFERRGAEVHLLKYSATQSPDGLRDSQAATGTGRETQS